MKNGYYKYEDGEYWYLNGKWHREDGPAVIYSDGTQAWYINGKDLTEEVNEWFKQYNLTYDTLSSDELDILKFNILCFSKNK